MQHIKIRLTLEEWQNGPTDWRNGLILRHLPGYAGLWCVQQIEYIAPLYGEQHVRVCAYYDPRFATFEGDPVPSVEVPPQPKGDSMNYSTAIFLINPKVRAVVATYEPDPPEHSKEKKPDRVVFKTFDQTITEGDLVLVPTETRWKMTVCKVVAVDVEADIESSAHMHWIVGVVDRAPYDAVVKGEAQAINMMKAAEKTHARNELRDKLMAHVNTEELAKLQIANMTGQEIQAPAAPGSAPVTDTKTS